MMSLSEYPKMKYNANLEHVVVKNAKEESLIGPEWKNSPADFGIETAPAKPEKKKITIEDIVAQRKLSEPTMREKGLEENNEDELKFILMKKGITKRHLKDKTKEELLQMIESTK